FLTGVSDFALGNVRFRRRMIVHCSARSYLLAGFTAASIVAAIPLAPRPTVDPPRIHFSDVRLAAATMTSAGGIVPSDLIPLVGDFAAFDFDLLGTPFAVATGLSFAVDLAISDLSSGFLQDIPHDVVNSLEFSIGSRVSLLAADIIVLTDAVNHLSGIINPAPPSNVETREATSTPVRAAFDPT